MSDTGPDHLSNELALEASLSEKGISGRVKLRAAAALDRLVGSLFDIPTAKLEAVSRRIRARSDQETKLIASETAVAKNAIEDDEELGRIVGQNHLLSQIKYVTNKRTIANLSIEHLSKEDLPEEGDSEDISVDEDWLNYFEQYAEKASTERMQDLWARVLAGEIRKPQSFSLATLRFLAEIDKEMASLFEKVAKHRLEKGFILKPGNEELKGQNLLNLTFLEEVGLLQNISLGLNLDGPANDGIVFFKEGGFVLRTGSKENIALGVIRITRIGREIAKILPSTDKISVLENIEKMISDKVKFSEIHKIDEEYVDRFSSHLIKIIKPRTT